MRHEFVETIPSTLEEGVLYISIRYKTCQHKCCCGCGERVVTPLDPKFWRLTFNGQSVSLNPSIGNRDFTCRSHYFIANNRIRWSWPFDLHEEENSKTVGHPIYAESANPVAKKSKGKFTRMREVLRSRKSKS